MPAIMTVAAAIFCHASLWGSGWFADLERKELERQERAAREMTHKYQVAAKDVSRIHLYYPKFEAYRNQGIIGDGDRAEWVALLGQQARERQLIRLNYSIAPSIPFALPSIGTLAGADLQSSVMAVEMGLLHEGEMLDLISGLGSVATRGLLGVNECSLERRQKGGGLDRSGKVANFTGRCQFLWFNIKGRASHWGEGG